jgi:phosphatidylglycerophosphate synthase
MNEKNRNVPNIISACRIASVPFMVLCVCTNREMLFTWLLLGALISDILDGVIARTFNMTTKLGSFLDSLGDMGTYGSAIFGIFVFKMDFIRNYWPAISAIIGMYVLEKVFCFWRYKKVFNAFHTYMSKITAYAQGAFAVSLFLFGFKWYLFYPAMILGILANIEEIILGRILHTYENDVKGLFWVLRRKQKAA